MAIIFCTVTSMSHPRDIFGCKKRSFYGVLNGVFLQENAWTEKELERRGQGGDLGAPLAVRCRKCDALHLASDLLALSKIRAAVI